MATTPCLIPPIMVAVPWSNPENRQPVREMLSRRVRTGRRILDVGPGQGTYVDLLRPLYPEAEFTCVEKWAPYVQRFELDSKYDRVIVADAAWLDWSRVAEGASLVIFGDVLEHMGESDAQWCWTQARAHSEFVLLSIPVTYHPQDARNGNPYEAHVTQWSHDKVLETFPGIEEYWLGNVVGVYLATACSSNGRSPDAYGRHSARSPGAVAAAHDHVRAAVDCGPVAEPMLDRQIQAPDENAGPFTGFPTH